MATQVVPTAVAARILEVDLCFHLPRAMELFLPWRHRGRTLVDEPRWQRQAPTPSLFENGMVDASPLLSDLERLRIFPQFDLVKGRDGEIFFKVKCREGSKSHSQEARELLYRHAWSVKVYSYERPFCKSGTVLAYSFRSPQQLKMSEARYALRMVEGRPDFVDRNVK